MKRLSEILNQNGNSGDERNFIDQQVSDKKIADLNGNGDSVFSASNVKPGVPLKGQKPIKSKKEDEVAVNPAPEAVHEGMRLLKKYEQGEHMAKVYNNWEYGEHVVHFFKNGKHMGDDAAYHTDDKDDAHATAQAELKRMSGIKEEYNADAVQKEINKDKRIKGKEAKMIHALLKGRSKEDNRTLKQKSQEIPENTELDEEFHIGGRACTYNPKSQEWKMDHKDYVIQAKSSKHALDKALKAIQKEHPDHKEHEVFIKGEGLRESAELNEFLDAIYEGAEYDLDEVFKSPLTIGQKALAHGMDAANIQKQNSLIVNSSLFLAAGDPRLSKNDHKIKRHMQAVHAAKKLLNKDKGMDTDVRWGNSGIDGAGVNSPAMKAARKSFTDKDKK